MFFLIQDVILHPLNPVGADGKGAESSLPTKQPGFFPFDPLADNRADARILTQATDGRDLQFLPYSRKVRP